jgi:hypothetical protein
MTIDRSLKAHKMQVQIPWDVSNMFGDFLSEETDGADDEEVAAYEDSKKRLRVRVSSPLLAIPRAGFGAQDPRADLGFFRLTLHRE